MVHIGNDWDELLKDEFQKEYYLRLRRFLAYEYKHHTVYPDMYDIFNALRYTAYADGKVVLLGQDPYHGPHQAQGLSFSVPDSLPAPPSLKNILKELEEDLGPRPFHDLTSWAEQGVLLLNACLTVPAGQANGHAGQVWEPFTDAVIKVLNQKDTPVVFILWGGYARKKKALVTNPKHAIIESAHPSPLSAYRGFFGSRPFSKANAYLVSQGQSPIDWLK